MFHLKMDPQLEGAVEVHPFSQINIKWSHSLYCGPYHSHFIFAHETAEYIPSIKVSKGLLGQKTLIYYEFCFIHPPKSVATGDTTLQDSVLVLRAFGGLPWNRTSQPNNYFGRLFACFQFCFLPPPPHPHPPFGCIRNQSINHLRKSSITYTILPALPFLMQTFAGRKFKHG